MTLIKSTGSQTELFCNVVLVALCERQSVGNDQRIPTWHEWRLSCLNARNPKMIMCIGFPWGPARLSRLRVFVGPLLLSGHTEIKWCVCNCSWWWLKLSLASLTNFIRKFICFKRKGFTLGILFWGCERFTRSFIGSLGLALLGAEGTLPFLPGFFGMSVRTVNERFMPLFAHDCLK